MDIRPKAPPPARRRLLRRLVAACALGLLAGACKPSPPVSQTWPEGHLLVARTAALRSLLEQLARIEGTHIARRSAALLGSLPECAWVEARSAATAAEPWATLDCFDPNGDLGDLDRARGEADIVFALAGAANERTTGTLTVSAGGSVDAQIVLPEARFGDARALLLPGSEPPGPGLLSREDELVHARLRPADGLDIASLVPASGQADHMFRLKSELFAGVVLDGTWEAAVYLPEPGHPMPRAALAVGFALREPAIKAMEGFLNELRGTWPVRRSDFAVADARGACLRDLKLMPDFEPCYVATDAALVIGWNPASVRQALTPPPVAGRGEPQDAHALTVELARIPRADALLAALEPEAPAVATTVWPWERLTADGRREGAAVRVHIRLAGGSGA